MRILKTLYYLIHLILLILTTYLAWYLGIQSVRDQSDLLKHACKHPECKKETMQFFSYGIFQKLVNISSLSFYFLQELLFI